jgi:hypothetical protein
MIWKIVELKANGYLWAFGVDPESTAESLQVGRDF